MLATIISCKIFRDNQSGIFNNKHNIDNNNKYLGKVSVTVCRYLCGEAHKPTVMEDLFEAYMLHII